MASAPVTIDDLVDAVIQREGGFVDNPADKGGPTKFGITENIARAFGYTGRMQDFGIDQARIIYVSQYWNRPSFAQVNLIYHNLANELFDTGINMGPKQASEMLQRALNVLNRGATDYPDIKIDGDIGRLTLYALEQYKAKRGDFGETVILRLLNAYQACRYTDIVIANPSQEDFMFGWIANRVN